MEAMRPPIATTTWAPPTEIAGAIRLLCEVRDTDIETLGNSVDGMSKSTLYRRMAAPETFTLIELQRVATRLGVPPEVVLGGRFFTMRWLADNDGGRTPDGGPAGLECAPWDLNPEPADMGRAAVLRMVLSASGTRELPLAN